MLAKAQGWKRVLAVLVFFMPCAGAADSATHLAVAGRDVAVWKPAGSAPQQGYPLVVFSHGYTGCNTQSAFLMEALARAGYFVIAPNHHDAGCGDAKGRGWYPGKMLSRPPQRRFRDPKSWSDETFKDRYEDVEAVLNQVLRTKSFDGVPIDAQRVGSAGHSLGGYTALGIAGGWRSWKDRRIKAVLALSPHCSPLVDHGNLQLGIPVMYQGGMRDFGETPVVRRPGGAFDHTSNPKYYVELEGAGHFAWTNLNHSYWQLIDAYSIAFFDRYLKGPGNPDRLKALITKPRSKGISDIRWSLR